MEDENIGIHLPAGKAAKIDPVTFSAKDGIEEKEDKAYRIWKDEQRRKNIMAGGIFSRNLKDYRNGLKPIFAESSFVKAYFKNNEKQGAACACNKIKIGFLSAEPNSFACPYLRLYAPLTILQKNNFIELLTLSQTTKGKLRLNLESLAKCDIIIVQRQFPALIPYKELVKHIDRSRQKIVYEFDDAFAKLPPSYVNYQYGIKISPLIEYYIMKADLVTVSTETLKSYYNHLNNNVVVIPNCLDLQLWKEASQNNISSSPVRILFSGTLTHSDDLGMIESAIENVLNEFRNRVRFFFWGNIVERLRRYPQVKVFAKFTPDYAAYANILQNTPMHFSIIPLKDNAFNQAKSHIKWLEYSACKIPGIYSNIGEYRISIRNKETGLLVENTTEKWQKAMRDFIIDKTKRERIADAAYKEVFAKHTLEKNSQLWIQAFKNIIGNSEIRDIRYGGLSKPKASIIIPIFNQVEFTKQCLEALTENTPNELYEVIIVNNASTDGTKDFLITLKGNVKIIANTENLGFAKACNQGAQAASGEYLVFLNNDTLPHKNWLTELVDVADAWNDVGIVGSKLLFPDNTIQHAGVAMLPVLSHMYTKMPSKFMPANKPRDLHVVTAACMLIRKDLFFDVGCFHEGYINGCEDIDLCLSVRAAGKRVFYNPRSVLTHFEGQTPGREDRMDDNRKLLFKRWKDKIPSDYENYLFDDGFRKSPEDSSNWEYHQELCKRTISIVIVTYNSLPDIGQCLSSIQAQTNLPHEIIVVDNNSNDGTKELLKELNGCTVILNNENMGFSRATNEGIKKASGEYIVLLNPDTIVTADWAWHMMLHFKKRVGAVGPISNYVAGLQKMELYLRENLATKLPIEGLAQKYVEWNRGKSLESKLLIGFCLMIPRFVIEQIGMLDEDLFLGSDDLEYSHRLRTNGFKLMVATDTFIYHKGQASFKTEPSYKMKQLTQESQDTLFRKLEKYYGRGKVPSSQELWDMNWFKPTNRPSNLTSIIILTFNQLEYTKKCLESIAAKTPEPHEIIIVDNGSTDGTVEWLRNLAAENSNYRLIENKENLGFALGNNKGIAEAKGDYIVLMNNDVVVTPGWLKRLVGVAQKKPQIGIVGPMSNYVSGPQLVKEVTYKKTSLVGLSKFSKTFARKHAGQTMPYWRVVGFCMLIKREVIDKIGGLDGRFGLGNFEDDDFSLRAALAGFESWIVKDCFVHHFGSRTFAGAKIDFRESLHKNWEIFKEKWGIPADVAYGASYDMGAVVRNGFIPEKHYCPLSDKEYISPYLNKEQEDTDAAHKMYQNAQMLVEKGTDNAAIMALGKLLESYPDFALAHNDLGVLYYKAGKKEDAFEHYKKAAELQPENINFQKNLADFYYVERGKVQEAIEIYVKILALDPRDIECLLMLGHISVSIEKIDDAKVFYMKVLESDPDNAVARQNLDSIQNYEQGTATVKPL